VRKSELGVSCPSRVASLVFKGEGGDAGLEGDGVAAAKEGGSG
jgi:hypothetical protein